MAGNFMGKAAGQAVVAAALGCLRLEPILLEWE